MNWKNTENGLLPGDGEEVMIAVEREKFLAVYDAHNNSFALSELGGLVYTIGTTQIYWVEIQCISKKPE